MRFTFEEAELINSFFEEVKEVPTKEAFIAELEQAKANTEDPELIEIANATIQKLKTIDEETLNKIFSNLPLDTYTLY